MALGKFHAIVFDFDGVLAASTDTKTTAFCKLFAAHGEDVVARVRAHHLANLGISRFVKFDWIYANVLHQPLSDTTRAELGAQFAELVVEAIVNGPLVAGARDALNELHGKLPLYVASGTPHEELLVILQRMSLRDYFHNVWGSPTVKPAALSKVAAFNACAPHDVLMIGDGKSDYDAARAAGTEFLGCGNEVPWRELGVRRVADLVGLPDMVAAWK